ncbi:uncharacterized protein SPSK_04697 [Sporothrix schenckii 1099-18]|uniref:Uncharacterized protein n=1 Tax=Sporothrix schenckii 1099-18 TaxID=1397361 RepID=A0A0F2M287_SPOSC|nr:uncharacterized protein SPSK_04697 [Sporothrix schenckii 1099-18]KJR83204.1 hypothetical protein SPSK_04697 [Sporothrix schenckii 1099-18]
MQENGRVNVAAVGYSAFRSEDGPGLVPFLLLPTVDQNDIVLEAPKWRVARFCREERPGEKEVLSELKNRDRELPACRSESSERLARRCGAYVSDDLQLSLVVVVVVVVE